MVWPKKNFFRLRKVVYEGIEKEDMAEKRVWRGGKFIHLSTHWISIYWASIYETFPTYKLCQCWRYAALAWEMPKMNAPLNPVHLQVISSPLCPAHTVHVPNTHLMKLHHHQLPQDKIQTCHLCATLTI